MRRSGAAFLLILLIATSGTFAAIPAARAKLEKPAYVAGDRWVYDLRGSLDGFPGTNASEVGTFEFDLIGRVDVDVVGTGTANVGGTSIPVVRVQTRATGFLNGTFEIPNGTIPGGSGTMTGSFVATTAELWETSSYLTVASNGTTTYLASVVLIFTIDLTMAFRLDATTTYGSIPPFDLDIGGSASTSFTTDLLANTTISGFGDPIVSEDETTVVGTWSREVLSETDVTVVAGTYHAYVINQSLGSFPGLGGLVPGGGGNETAYWSNSAGNYVKREAYANGTEVAEMTLRSSTYPYRPGLTLLDIVLWGGLPLAVLAAAVAIVVRRRRRRRRQAASPSRGGEPPAR